MEKNEEDASDKINIPINEELNNINSSNEDNSLLSEEKENNILNQNPKNSSDYNNNLNGKKSGELNMRMKEGYFNGKNHGNIGKNKVLCNKYVFGPTNSLCLVIMVLFGVTIAFYLWMFFMRNFCHIVFYIFFHIPLILTHTFMILAYITEPGIIPRNCPDFPIKENETNEKEKSEDENQKKIPRIFTERKCRTCNIMRPSGASHCGMCDNCVLGFDHHCVFISNCVGKRNHKYFYLFLFFGSFLSQLVIIINLAAIINVFIVNHSETISLLYEGNKWLLILSFVLILIGVLCSMNLYPRIDYIVFIGIGGYGLFLYLWCKYFKKNDETPSYYNPYIIITLVINVSLGIPITVNFIAQSYHISKGFTVKQLNSIKNKRNEFFKDNKGKEIEDIYLRKLSCKEIMKNFISFLSRKKEKSLIIPERDLINN